MKRENQKNKVSEAQPAKVLPILPGILVIAAAFILLFSFLIYFMASSGIMKLPGLLGDLFAASPTITESGNAPWNDFLSSIGGNPEKAEFDIRYADYTDVTIGDILLYDDNGDYFQLYDISYAGNNENKTVEVSAMHGNGKARFDRYLDGSLEKTVVYNGEDIKIYDSTGSCIYNAGDKFFETFSAETEIGIPSVNELKKRLEKYEKSGYVLTVMRDGKNNIFRITCKNELLGVREVYDIKAESGILVSCELYFDGDDLPYLQIKTLIFITSVDYTSEQFEIK